MCIPCVYHEELMSLDVILLTLTPIQTPLDPSRPLVLPDHSRLCHMTSRSHALSLLQTNNNTTILFLSTNSNSKVCPYTHLITVLFSEPLQQSQILIQITNISELRDVFIIQSRNTNCYYYYLISVITQIYFGVYFNF